MALVLYSTDGCHLCELAQQVYKAVGHTTAFNIVDIAFDETLFSRYGVTIPVLSWQQSDGEIINELNWPFNDSELSTWLIKNGIN